MTKRTLHNLTLTKIAAVDFPCQEPAQALIIKRADDGAKIDKTICDAIRKSGIGISGADDTAGAFGAMLGDQPLTQPFWDGLSKAADTLQKSLESIVKDEAVIDKESMVAQSIREFADYTGETIPGDIGKALAAGIAAMFAGPAGPTVQGDNTMTDAIKKALGLPVTATEAEVLKAMEEKDKKLKDTEKECNVAKMSDKHKAFAANPDAKMPAGGKDKFAEMTAAERDAHMSAHPVDDEDTEVEKALKAGNAFKTAEGSIVLKRKVGEEVFGILKAMNAKSAAQETELAKAREDKITKEFEDLASENGFAKGFAPTLRKALQGADAESRAALLKEFKAARAQADVGGVFKEFGGHGGPSAGSAEAEVLAKRDQLMAADPKLSPEQAYARVWKDKGNAELRKRYNTEKGSNA